MVWNLLSPKPNLYCSVDIGTESVKAVIFCIKKNKKNSQKAEIIGWGISHFDKFDILGSGDFNRQILEKAISQAFDSAKINACFSSADRKVKQAVVDEKRWKTIVGLSPLALQAKIVQIQYFRKKEKKKINFGEEREIFNAVFDEAKTKIAEKFCAENGISPQDIYWNSLEFVNVKMDGYEIAKLRNYEGKELNFQVLATFMPKYYQDRIFEILFSLNFEILKFFHIAQGLNNLPKEEKTDGFYIDIGGDVTQIIGIRNGNIARISEFKRGANSFAQILSTDFGLDLFSSNQMIEDYSEKKLSAEATQRIKEILSSERFNWFEDFKNDLKKSKANEMFPANFWFLGGGAKLPEFVKILEENGGKDLEKTFTFDHLKYDFFTINKLDLIENKTNDLKEIWLMPSLLLCYNFLKETKKTK